MFISIMIINTNGILSSNAKVVILDFCQGIKTTNYNIRSL